MIALLFFTADKGNKALLALHSGLIVLAWGILYPILVFMSTDIGAKWVYIPLQSLQLVVMTLAAFCLLMYIPTAPSLYPGAIYPGATVAMLLLAAIHWLSFILMTVADYNNQKNSADGISYVLANLHGAGQSHSQPSGEVRLCPAMVKSK